MTDPTTEEEQPEIHDPWLYIAKLKELLARMADTAERIVKERDELVEALDMILANDGSRARFSALALSDARDRAEALLAAQKR